MPQLLTRKKKKKKKRKTFESAKSKGCHHPGKHDQEGTAGFLRHTHVARKVATTWQKWQQERYATSHGSESDAVCVPRDLGARRVAVLRCTTFD